MASTWYRRGGKRALDLGVVVPLAILTSPLSLVLWLLVRWRLGAPALFRQQRPGRNGEIFTLVKYRTMTQERDGTGALLPDAERLTGLGQFLRATSLDEIPELWNVFRGDMSLVGPRPLLVRYLDRYTPEQARRHEVRPGVTGWAQVNGRNAVAWDDKFRMDTWYVDNLSFGLDAMVLWRTLVTVVKREGISAAGQATAAEFTGRSDGEEDHG